MDDSSVTDICRACLTKEGEFKSVFISDEKSGVNIHLAEMIMAYASVQITLGDGLPEQICVKCAERAVDMYLFKLCCEKSDAALRKELGKSPFIDEFNKQQAEDNFEHVNLCRSDTVNIVVKPEISLEADDSQIIQDEKEEDNSFATRDDDTDSDYEQWKKNNVCYLCEICQKSFTDQAELKTHQKDQHFKEFICDTCGKDFSGADLLLQHKIVHTIKIENQDVKFSAIENIINNEIMPSSRIEFRALEDLKCIQSAVDHNKQSDTVSPINKHEKGVNNVLQCSICTKKFNKMAHLTRHMKIHVAIKPHTCHLCKKGFTRGEQLINHMNAHSGIKPHVCKICSKGFNQISNLKDHMRTHNGEKPFLCSTCGKGFNQLGNLRQHTIRHSGVKAHLCSICGNGFASKGELSAHLRKHTGARPFVCSVCNHGFTTSSSLTKHKRIHSGEKPYECEVCKMKFSRSGILARHKRTHTGEKPYVCKFCSKAFSQSNDLSSHLRIHTGEKPFICDSCGQAFRQSSALKTHKKTHIDRSPTYDARTLIGHVVQSTFMNTLQ